MNLRGCSFECFAERRINSLPCVGHLMGRYAHGCFVTEPVKLGCITKQRMIATATNTRNDAVDHRQHALERRTAAVLQRGQNFSSLTCSSTLSSNQLHGSRSVTF